MRYDLLDRDNLTADICEQLKKPTCYLAGDTLLSLGRTSATRGRFWTLLGVKGGKPTR